MCIHMNKDLTVGKPEKVLWKFCIPLFGSVIFQQLYNIADSFVAGKFIDENALAAVGNSYEITLIFIAFAFGCNMGCSVIVSQYFGAKKYAEMKTAVYTALIASAVVCILLMLFGFSAGNLLLEMIHTPEEIMEDSLVYLRIYVLGLPFLFFYNIATGIFSALGDSKTPFIFLACSSTINILVDIWFVAALQMGVPGVAWATFICQGISCILAMGFVLNRLKRIETKESYPVFSVSMLKKITTVAVPSILQQSFISLGNILLQREINGYGAGVIAGYSAAIKLNNLVITSLTTIGNGVSGFTAQNMGAGILKRVKEGYRASVKMVWIICIPVVILYWIFAAGLVGVFIDSPTPLALQTGQQFLRIVSPFYFVVALKLVSDGLLRGARNMGAFMISTFTDLILRVSLAFLFSHFFGAVGIWCAWPFGWIVGTILSALFCRKITIGRDASK